MKIDIVKLNKDITLSHATDGAAGYDVQACLYFKEELRAGEALTIPLGFAMSMGKNIAAILLPRSGLGAKGLVLQNTIGLIDSDYQGEVCAMVKNTGNFTIVIKPMMRIAQLIFIPILHMEFNVVESFTTITNRGINGFGSTGDIK